MAVKFSKEIKSEILRQISASAEDMMTKPPFMSGGMVGKDDDSITWPTLNNDTYHPPDLLPVTHATVTAEELRKAYRRQDVLETMKKHRANERLNYYNKQDDTGEF